MSEKKPPSYASWTHGKLPLTELSEMKRRGQKIVMVTAFASVASAVEAMRYGAFDYIEKPFDVEQLESLVSRALRHGEKVGRRSSVPAQPAAWESIMVGESPALRALRGDKAVWKLVERHPRRMRRLAVDRPLPRDVDTWEDYQEVATVVGRCASVSR